MANLCGEICPTPALCHIMQFGCVLKSTYLHIEYHNTLG